jgi:hypothetical protein
MKKLIGVILVIICDYAFTQKNQRFSNPTNLIKHNILLAQYF